MITLSNIRRKERIEKTCFVFCLSALPFSPGGHFTFPKINQIPASFKVERSSSDFMISIIPLIFALKFMNCCLLFSISVKAACSCNFQESLSFCNSSENSRFAESRMNFPESLLKLIKFYNLFAILIE